MNVVHFEASLQSGNRNVNIVHMRARKRESYHHGDLRSALIKAALEGVRRDGMENFKLREVAREIGVAPAAAYNHFVDKNELLAAVALETQIMLARRTMEATSGLTGEKRLDAVGRAYIEFARDEPRLFRLVFSRLGAGTLRDSYKTADSGSVPSSYEQLRTAVAEIQPDKQQKVDGDLLAFGWSVAHGAASLISDGVWQSDDGRADAALRLAMGVMLTRSQTPVVRKGASS
jgi:AcrR family transcriptional regulator